jgi:hypothetical protein
MTLTALGHGTLDQSTLKPVTGFASVATDYDSGTSSCLVFQMAGQRSTDNLHRRRIKWELPGHAAHTISTKKGLH